jgi:hypothetical protein
MVKYFPHRDRADGFFISKPMYHDQTSSYPYLPITPSVRST